MNVILGITGSVSAYKTPWLVRDLRRAGHDVRVIMTPSAREFVAPLALEATSTHSVVIDPYDPAIQDGGSWHVHFAQWADVMLVAPCSATNTFKDRRWQLRHSTSNQSPQVYPPTHRLCLRLQWILTCGRSRQRNGMLRPSRQMVCQSVIDPESGSLASGLVGKGRLPELGDHCRSGQ